MHSSMSPKGVEHEYAKKKTDMDRVCIHQCRRKALSTKTGTREFPNANVHSSMSPKGVEHASAQPRRECSTEVHSSMSPKGVEHSGYAWTATRICACAFINVAERR